MPFLRIDDLDLYFGKDSFARGTAGVDVGEPVRKERFGERGR